MQKEKKNLEQNKIIFLHVSLRTLYVDQEKGKIDCGCQMAGGRSHGPSLGFCLGSWTLKGPPLAEEGKGSRGLRGHALSDPAAPLPSDHTSDMPPPRVPSHAAPSVPQRCSDCFLGIIHSRVHWHAHPAGLKNGPQYVHILIPRTWKCYL